MPRTHAVVIVYLTLTRAIIRNQGLLRNHGLAMLSEAVTKYFVHGEECEIRRDSGSSVSVYQIRPRSPHIINLQGAGS